MRLVSFAVHWIKAEIHEYIIRNWRLVKVATTKAQRKLFFNLRSMRPDGQTLDPEQVDHIAQRLERSPRGRQRNGSAHVRPRHVARKPGR